ncbi:MAG: glycolate oxidase subunit GlcE [Methylococcaceae bacterium]|nr:glycolate oxidase subunit GlcE [Methylococcaceae bacterium]
MCIMVICPIPNSTDFNVKLLPHEQDLSEFLREQVQTAFANKTPLAIQGSGSKSFYGHPVRGEPLSVSRHRGIIRYEPTELVITARCGTRLSDLEDMLAEHNQMLAFEPPYFGADATLGGAVATGLSGPRRPYAGSARDVVLGVRLLNGRGESLKFGGEVIKNVAGFDVSRLMVGALGTLGLLLDISMKVLPRPDHESTLLFSMSRDAALTQMNRWTNQNWPLSAASYDDENLRIRLSGAATALARVHQQLGGELLANTEAANFWSDLREQRLAFFQGETPLWRLSMAPAAKTPNVSGSWLMDWGGALRWLKTEQACDSIFREAEALNAHACLFRSTFGSEFQPLPPALAILHRNIKLAFDPAGIFNPGRLYADW